MYIFIKVSKRNKPVTDTSAKPERRKKHFLLLLPSCFVSLVWSPLCTQFIVQLVFDLQCYKTHIWHTSQRKAEAQTRTLCLFSKVGPLSCLFPLLLFEVAGLFFLIILHGLSALRCCCCIVQLASVSCSIRHTSTGIQSRGSQHIRRRSVDVCHIYSQAVEAAECCSVSLWHWSLGKDKWLYQPSSSQPHRAVCQS